MLLPRNEIFMPTVTAPISSKEWRESSVTIYLKGKEKQTFSPMLLNAELNAQIAIRAYIVHKMIVLHVAKMLSRRIIPFHIQTVIIK